MQPLRLIVGLGNPGRQYHDTRHNAGFWWVDRVVTDRRADWQTEGRFFASIARLRGDHALWLLKPQTYMNASGRSVGAFARFHGVAVEEILVVHDELDLPPGVVKLKLGGGHAGHNGLKDLSPHLGSNAFWRLRIGIGHPGDRRLVSDYVLHEAQREEREAIDDAIERSLGCFDSIAQGDFAEAMRVLHTNGNRIGDQTE